MTNYVQYIARIINENIYDINNEEEDLSEFPDINVWSSDDAEPECIITDNLKFDYNWHGPKDCYVSKQGELICKWADEHAANIAATMTDDAILDYLADNLDEHIEMGFRCKWNIERKDDRVIITPRYMEFDEDLYEDQYFDRYYDL